MRHKPCWSDCFPLHIFWTWIVAGLVAAILALYTCQPAYAGLYLDAAGGMTRFNITANDGDYIQRDQPHSLDLNSMAYKVGLGWRFNERWSIQAGYVNLGTINQTAKFVRDEDFDFKAGRCKSNCGSAIPYRMTDAYHGGEITVKRSFALNEDWFWHLKGGGAYLMHRFTINREDAAANGFHQLYGQFPAAVVGVGASYKWLYAELDYYKGLGGSNGFLGQDYNWPLSTEIPVLWFGVNLPIGG